MAPRRSRPTSCTCSRCTGGCGRTAKYLEWELRRHPLGAPLWAADALLPLLAAALTLEAGGAVRTLLNDLEPHARAAGHGEIYDSWGADLAFLRGR
ncbi:hypothetical protein AB0K18_18035 [Nonomuraea sp. NPDC049421]|uniref:hypothetical protein n=1 Tax=Nonomuraea sp. NPDC049421 TaxID=3155275 RepID=UPI0034251FF2